MLSPDKALIQVQSSQPGPHQFVVFLLSRLFLHLGHRDEVRTAPDFPLGVVFGVPLVHVCGEEDRKHQS